jgi:hypothetical protein
MAPIQMWTPRVRSVLFFSFVVRMRMSQICYSI